MIKGGARAFVSRMGKMDDLIPIILLELCVTGGRTYYAYKRGGFIEGRERITEESIAAVFWLGGVTAFNKMGDAIGKRVLGLNNVNFDVGKDKMRNPLENFLGSVSKHGEKAIKKLRLTNVNSRTLAIFKFAKVISSILLANAFVGFVLPKINQAITRHYQNSIENLDKNAKNHLGAISMNDFLKKASNKEKNPAFEGVNVQTLLTLAHSFENDAKYKLISTDAGITSGRAINARNKYERREILFRDLASIYFYMFCRKHLNSLLNYIEDGRSSRLDPVSANFVNEKLNERFQSGTNYSAENFEQFALGKKDVKMPKITFVNGKVELEELKKVMSKEKFEIAKKMSELQPKIGGKSFLTSYQVEDIYKGGLINDPELIKKVFEGYHKGSTTNPLKYVPEKDLIKLKQNMVDYVKDIIKKAGKTGENISAKTIQSISRQNFWKHTFNLGVGFFVSGYFLATAIPRIQYWLTKKQTGKDNFPGVEHYDK